jgi:hypothetical protein
MRTITATVTLNVTDLGDEINLDPVRSSIAFAYVVRRGISNILSNLYSGCIIDLSVNMEDNSGDLVEISSDDPETQNLSLYCAGALEYYIQRVRANRDMWALTKRNWSH